MGSATGAAKAAATRVGVSPAEYDRRVLSGEKWCIGCKEWHSRDQFARDRSRHDGLTASCKVYRSGRSRELYTPRPGPGKGRRYAPAREGDTKQARGRVNYLVNAGLLSDPNDLPCTDCGHIYEVGQRRHEYDHYLGYAPEHHEDVEPVCTTCHHAREAQRRAA